MKEYKKTICDWCCGDLAEDETSLCSKCRGWVVEATRTMSSGKKMQ
jgi:hypothetical protein